MCGIAGIFDPTGRFGADALGRMNNALQHRGPDANGVFSDGDVHLGHRRLSVIDLSDAANQPFHSACGRYAMVFNGEVYNYLELRAELGLMCRTNSDTEVILEAFAKLGPAFINRLNGMFAIAIYDRSAKLLHLFRDRIGIKPILYYWDGRTFMFASEIKAIRQFGSMLTMPLDRLAIAKYLHLGYIPAPQTAYQNTFKFPAGHRGVFDGRELRTEPFWSIGSSIKSQLVIDEKDAVNELERLITSSVQYRMISDVPFGTFLSGGIDSSTVTAIAQKLSPKPIKTFSIGFSGSKHNEAEFARAVAAHLGTDHQAYNLSEHDALELLPDITKVYDEPYADSSAAPTMLVSKVARQQVTMTLSGDGGDELFHGYGAYTWAERLDNPMLWAARKPLTAALSMGNDRYKRIADLLSAPDQATLSQHIFSQEQYLFSAFEIGKMMVTQVDVEWPKQPACARKLTAAERQAVFDLGYYLPDDLLTKVDRASMRYALETRVPLLDHRIIEFALNLHPSLKTKHGESKYLLKQVLYRHVPKGLFDRPKWGFSIPLVKWLKGELRVLESDYLNEAAVRKAGVVDPQVVAQVRHRFHAGEDRLYNRLWLLIVLHKWMDEQNLTWA